MAGAQGAPTCSATRGSLCTAAPTSPTEWAGDAKLAGVVEEITDPERVREINGEAAAGGQSHLFRLDLREASTVGLNDERTALVIEVWTPEGGIRTMNPLGP